MKFMEILNEFNIKPNDPHFNDRTLQRCFGQEYFDVVARKTNESYKTEKPIGLYKIPQEAKNHIRSVIEELKKPYYWAERGHIFIVELYEFVITPELITFTGSPHEQQMNKNLFNHLDIYTIELREKPLPDELSSPQDNLSRGHYLVCHINNNDITTMFLSRSSDPQYHINRSKRSAPKYEVVFIKDPFTELDAYIDIENAKRYHEKSPQTPQEPQEPQMTEKELKKYLYNEKMKKERERHEKLRKYNKR